MDLRTKIDDSLVKKRLYTLAEAGPRTRLRPATILTKRDTVIEADHARIVRHLRTKTPILVMGIRPGIYPRRSTNHQKLFKHFKSVTGNMRDFTSAGQYVPTSWQDETGWCEPDETGRYDAHRDFEWNAKFKHIFTAFMENIKNINWHNKPRKELEPEKIDYRGRGGQSQWIGNPVAMLFEFGFPQPILDNFVNQLVEGINLTIRSRSEYFGLEQTVHLLKLLWDDGPEAIAVWESRGHKGRSVIPRGMTFGELSAFLDEESSDYWNS